MLPGARRSFRVHLVTHGDGRVTGTMLRNWRQICDQPPPSAYGASEEEVYRQLEVLLAALELGEKGSLDRYLWEESFETREITVPIHPQTAVKKRKVIGKRRIPLRLTYAFCAMPQGGYRVMLPRFDWWFVCEDLEVAPEVLRAAVSSALLGEKPRWVYDFRHEGPEVVREWAPRLLLRRDGGDDDDDGDTFELPTLNAVAEELTRKAVGRGGAGGGKLAPVVGDLEDFDRHLALLARSPPPSILLVGGPGVGKSTWVRRLARHLAQRRREAGKDRHVARLWATSGERIIAGMIYLGMWQERCLSLVDELAHEGDYLYVDRLTSILAPQPDGSSIAELLQPALEAGEISLIAECSEPELERARRRHPRLLSAFHLVRLAETPPSAMPGLLERYQARKVGPAGPTIHAAALKRLVSHLEMFQKDARFPGKGFRFLDWLAANAGGEGGAARPRLYYPRDVSAAYARCSGLPIELISDEYPAGAEHIAAILGRRVIGQPAACATAARVLARLKAGLNDPERPCGSLFFVGPTGVGKTELAKQLAAYLFGDEARLLRFDMSEYMLPGSAGRLLEVGAGATSLAQKVRQQPLALVLLDEIEKAHPEVFDLLLGVLGEGRLTDALGRLVDFRMTVIVMTSNLGVSETGAIGFEREPAGDFAREVRRHFRPELFNRLDHVVTFRNLAPADVSAIVDLELDKAAARTGLVRRRLTLRLDPAAREELARRGFHPTRGARPLKRLIEERVVTPLAVRMARDPAFREREIAVVRAGSEAWQRLGERERGEAVVV